MSLKKRVQLGKININMTNKWFYSFVTLFIVLILGIGVFAADSWGPGDDPDGGHAMRELAAPEPCDSGEFLKYNGGDNWGCSNIESFWNEGEDSGDIYYDKDDAKVGIGTDNPSRELEVNGDIWADGTLRLAGDNTENMLEINSRDNNRYIKFDYPGNDGYGWRMGYEGSGNQNENYLHFLSEGNSGEDTYTEVMRMTLTSHDVEIPNGDLEVGGKITGDDLEVGGKVNAGEYCDEDGNNCFESGTALGSWDYTYDSNWLLPDEEYVSNENNVLVGASSASDVGWGPFLMSGGGSLAAKEGVMGSYVYADDYLKIDETGEGGDCSSSSDVGKIAMFDRVGTCNNPSGCPEYVLKYCTEWSSGGYSWEEL